MSKTEMPSQGRNESCTSPWPVMTDSPKPAAPVSFKQNSPRTYWSTCLQSVSWLAFHCGSSILPWLPTFKLWKQTNIHSHGKDLKKKAPGKPSPSQYLLIAFSPVLKFSGWPPVSGWVPNGLTWTTDSRGGKFRPCRKPKEPRTKDHQDLTWPSCNEANSASCWQLLPPLFASLPRTTSEG